MKIMNERDHYYKPKFYEVSSTIFLKYSFHPLYRGFKFIFKENSNHAEPLIEPLGGHRLCKDSAVSAITILQGIRGVDSTFFVRIELLVLVVNEI